MWFLNCRSEPVGGDVVPVRVNDGTLTHLTFPELLSEVRGKHLLLGVHGFNVHQAGAIDHFQQWNNFLHLGESAVFVGCLWPGDSSWLGALEYAFAAKTAMRSGDALAKFVSAQLNEALSVSFVSHSLGARVALRAIQQLDPDVTVRRLIMMAPAVSADALTAEFAPAAKRVEAITVLASEQDKVLEFAFPLGNPISGIFAEGHPYWHAALGRKGPATYPKPNNLHAGWLLPTSWAVDHSDYLPPTSPYPAGFDPGPFSLPMAFPALTAASPATGTPSGFRVNDKWQYWQSSWTAALTSLRFS